MGDTAGVVYLVGAGPGDPGLLTRRGEALLRRASVVVYDRLVAPALLELCPPSAQRVYVGKEPGSHAVPQDEINQLLVKYGLDGKRVVRLKGGDPFVFGRGGEEALALQVAGVRFEIVPGISSALAAPACAGIPVTHRGMASSVAIATGHEDPSKPDSSIAWSELARGVDTLVFVMGVENLSKISEQLLAAGGSADGQVALVRWGSTPEQETLFGTLGTIAETARERDFKPPAVLVVGPVVSLAHKLGWLEQRPLHGRRVLVTRAREQASALAERLAELGARPLEFPTIRIEPLEDTARLDATARRLPDFDWVMLTSANGVSAIFDRMDILGLDARAFGSAQVAAIGPATAAALAGRGIHPDFIPSVFTSDQIVADLAPRIGPGQRILLLRGDIAPPLLAERLAELGADVENVVAYRTLPDLDSRDEVRSLLENGKVDVVTFTSSSTVRNLVSGLDGAVQLLARPFVACIGPVTAATAAELGLHVDLVASVHTVDGLVEALLEQVSAEKSTPVNQGRATEVSA